MSPEQALDDDAGEQIAQRLPTRRELRHVESTAKRIDSEVATRNLPAERCPLKVKKSRRALQIGQRARITRLQSLEFLTARELPAEHVNKGHVMALQDSEERRNVA